MVHERTEAYAGVDVSKERLLEVCVRRGREAREGEDTFTVSPRTPPAHKRSWPAF